MDAAHIVSKKAVLLLPLALVAMAPELQAQPQFTAIGSVNTSIGGTQVRVSGNGDPNNPITFTAAITSPSAPNGDPQNWLTLNSPGPFTTPTVVTVAPGNLGAFAGTYTATVTLTASTAGVTPISFTVTYQSGTTGGGGGGTITASPAAVTLTAAPGLGATTSVTLTTTSAAPIGFTVSNSPAGSWLTVIPFGTTVSSTSPATLQVSASAQGLTTTPPPGSITITPTGGQAVTTIPVTFTVGAGGTGNLTFSTPSVMTSTTGSVPTPQTVSIFSSAGSFNASVTSTSNGVQWLLLNNQVSVTNAPVSLGLTLSGSTLAASLTTGTYTATVFVTDSNGNSGSFTVTLVVNGGSGGGGLTLSPSSVTLNTPLGGTAQQQLTITSNTGGTLTLSPSNAPWLTVSGNPGTITAGVPVTVTLFAVSGSLGNSTNQGSLTITAGTQTQSVPVTFVVGTGSGGVGGSGGLSVAPASMVFSYQHGTPDSMVARQTIGITGPAGNAWTASTSTTDGAHWLQVLTISSNFLPDSTGSTIVAISSPSALNIGTYSGTVTISFAGGQQSVAVTLNVTGGPVLIPNPGSAFFNFHSGDSLAAQSIFLTASDQSTVSATATTTTPWLTVTQTSGSSTFSISANPAGLAAGLYSGSVTVTQSGMANSPLTVPVVLIVNGGGGTGGGGGPLTFSPASLTFSTVVGASPNAQSLSVSAATSTTFSVAPSTSSGVNWLSVSQSSGVASASPVTLSVFVNAAGLAASATPYTGSITFTAGGTTQVVPVSLTVSSTTGGGNVTATPASFTFTGQVGAGNPAPQATNILSAQGAAAVSFTVTTSGGSFLTTSAPAGTTLTTPLLLTVSTNANGLAAGTYNGSVIITPTNGTALTIPVTLTLTSPPTVSAAPASIDFTYRAGDAAPPPQGINVTANSPTGLGFTVTAASTPANWLVVSPTSGTTSATAPAIVNVSVNPAGLNASPTPYTGTVTIAGSGGASGTTTITVTLTVTAPLPTVSKLTNAGSFASGSISPGEIITLFSSDAQHPIGPATAALLTVSSGKVATTIGGVQVLVNGFAAPMVFANATQVSAIVPYELAGFTSADVEVKFLGQTSNALHVNVATTAPGLFTLNSSGTGPGAILNSNNSVNSPTNPANKGEIVVVYLTGEGQTSPAGVTGKVTTVSTSPPPAPLTPAPLLPVSVLIGAAGSQQPANFSFAGEAPGLVSGVLQLNVQIPATAASGDQQIVVSIGGNSSQSGVTVSVR